MFRFLFNSMRTRKPLASVACSRSAWPFLFQPAPPRRKRPTPRRPRGWPAQISLRPDQAGVAELRPTSRACTGWIILPERRSTTLRRQASQAQGNLDGSPGRRPVQAEKFNPKTFPFQLIGPYGIAVDSKGLVYVADQKVGAIFIFNPETHDTQLIRNGYEAHFAWINGLAHR